MYCYMLIAVPGSGKSTMVKSLQEDMPELEVASSDEHIVRYAAEKGRTYDEVHREYVEQAQKDMSRQIQAFIRNKKAFIWDQTNVVASARRKKIKMLHSNKYKVSAICIELSDEELQKRLIGRQALEPGKIMPERIMQMMKSGYERPSYDEGFEEIYLINDRNDYNLLRVGATLEKN